MGTNYYWTIDPETGKEFEDLIDEASPVRHIGKKSMSGQYCYTCGTTMCQDGTHGVHSGHSVWWTTCPICGSEPSISSSFTITMLKHKAWLKKYKDKYIVINEYDDKFTGKQMLDIINKCPIQFQMARNFC